MEAGAFSSSLAGPGAGARRDLEARVVGAESGQELWPRPAQAPDLQLEWLTEVAEPMEWDAPLGMEQPAGLLLQWAPQAR